ncbi:hypothetical protein [Photobacterium leiognathi]|uniref:hypothetical protein n=1 Tax=Photobacterium leiognathi TaxID=553611 RepID=UPI00298103E7|nr:hypothetical protein [Photobacterium leiognathi]
MLDAEYLDDNRVVESTCEENGTDSGCYCNCHSNETSRVVQNSSTVLKSDEALINDCSGLEVFDCDEDAIEFEQITGNVAQEPVAPIAKTQVVDVIGVPVSATCNGGVISSTNHTCQNNGTLEESVVYYGWGFCGGAKNLNLTANIVGNYPYQSGYYNQIKNKYIQKLLNFDVNCRMYYAKRIDNKKQIEGIAHVVTTKTPCSTAINSCVTDNVCDVKNEYRVIKPGQAWPSGSLVKFIYGQGGPHPIHGECKTTVRKFY